MRSARRARSGRRSAHRPLSRAARVPSAARGKPRFNLDDLRQQTLQGWHRLVGIELRLAVLALEGLICLPEDHAYQAVLAEQCARVGQLYAELKRLAGACFALTILRGELRGLRYRASPVIHDLLFPASGR